MCEPRLGIFPVLRPNPHHRARHPRNTILLDSGIVVQGSDWMAEIKAYDLIGWRETQSGMIRRRKI